MIDSNEEIENSEEIEEVEVVEDQQEETDSTEEMEASPEDEAGEELETEEETLELDAEAELEDQIEEDHEGDDLSLEASAEDGLEDDEAENLEASEEDDEVELLAEELADDEMNSEDIESPQVTKSGYSSIDTAASLSLLARIEAIIFAASKCMKTVDIYEVLDDESLAIEEVQAQIDILLETYRVRQGGFRLESVRGHGYQFRTVSEAGCYMERLFASRPRPLSRAALETLSIVAYRQPVSRADIEFIRGVDSGSIVKNLLERGLIKCVGRNAEVAGKPMIFGTTDEFLSVFRLNSLSDLPPLAAFQAPQDMVQDAEEQIENAEHLDEDSEDSPIENEGEDFVGVEGEDSPDVSGGILASGQQAEEGISEEESLEASDHSDDSEIVSEQIEEASELEEESQDGDEEEAIEVAGGVLDEEELQAMSEESGEEMTETDDLAEETDTVENFEAHDEKLEGATLAEPDEVELASSEEIVESEEDDDIVQISDLGAEDEPEQEN